MGVSSRAYRRSQSFLPRSAPLLAFFFLAALVLFEVDNFASQTKTIVGHNLEPTPWHPFPPKNFNESSRYSRASQIIQCSYLSCRGNTNDDDDDELRQNQTQLRGQTGVCPELFRWIHRDLEPWAQSRISITHVMEAKKYAAFHVVIVGGKLYVDYYFACVQSRAMFTVWGLLQLLRRYPGRVPDVDIMFDCMDKPSLNREEHQSRPLPLFRYCTTPNHFDIPFPDWSFWSWYKIYAEGYAWSVSLKYILSCGCLPLIISPQYEDFFSRGLFPKKNYWPVSSTNLCPSIKNAVEWGNAHLDQAAEIGRGSQDYMGSLNMDRVYDYMLHLITEYSKLLEFLPVPPSSALEVCAESLLCFADQMQRQFLERSASSPSPSPPCTLQRPNRNIINRWLEEKNKIIRDVQIFV
ncbi:uncharacterized protein LOC114297206 isoform X2 [Camellia sinensis]|uniref:uncharacterized protein LOC114297206 isoform X2 n=1 Tax=Camellia sinensis TaxID=4442 RepID=UPI001035BD8C|nr:uncharacterized protein LOC114297206 isoform X2 [Camellia sinensis]